MAKHKTALLSALAPSSQALVHVHPQVLVWATGSFRTLHTEPLPTCRHDVIVHNVPVLSATTEIPRSKTGSGAWLFSWP